MLDEELDEDMFICSECGRKKYLEERCEICKLPEWDICTGCCGCGGMTHEDVLANEADNEYHRQIDLGL